MGRGRTGFGYARWSHVSMKVEKVDFNKIIEESDNLNKKNMWTKRLELVNKMKGLNKSNDPIAA